MVLLDHRIVEEQVPGEASRGLRANKYGAFPHGNRFLKGLRRLAGFGHAKHIAGGADAPGWGQAIEADSLVLVLYGERLSQPFDGGFGRRVHKGSRRRYVLAVRTWTRKDASSR